MPTAVGQRSKRRLVSGVGGMLYVGVYVCVECDVLVCEKEAWCRERLAVCIRRIRRRVWSVVVLFGSKKDAHAEIRTQDITATM